MKLVIDASTPNDQVTLVVSGVELPYPLTRDQVVKILYGEGFAIVRAGGGEAEGRPRKTPKAAPEEAASRRGKGKKRGAAARAIVAVLEGCGTGDSARLRAALEKRDPSLLRGKGTAYLAGTLARMVGAKVLVASGTRGSRVYRIAAASKQANGASHVAKGAS